MSRDDTEFDAYLAARWPALVRTLVLLGHPGPQAHAIAFDALARLQPDFRRLHREEDVDVAVHREVLEARERHLRHAPAGDEPPAAVHGEPGPGLADQAERLEQVTAALARMAPAQREVLVLLQVAELSPDQVADVLERRVDSGPVLADADVRLALEAIPVTPLTTGEVVEEARARRRRLVTRSLAGAVALAVVVAGAGWFWQRSEDIGQVTPARNPLPLAWYADGLLHLDEVTVEVRPVVDLVTVPGGVVLADEDGEVLMAEPDGELAKLGDTVPGEGLVVEPDNGWVAWADPGAGTPELVVFDTRVGDEVGRRSLSLPGEEPGQPVGESGPIAIDEERVYYSVGGTDYVWSPLRNEAFSLSGSLVDTADDARLSRRPDGGYLLQPAPLRSGVLIDGTDGQLTPDGRYAFVMVQDEVAVFDADTGQPLPRMYSPSDQALGWSYTEDGSFWFAVLHKLQDKQYQDTLQMPDEGDYRIYECVPGRDDVCVEAHRVPRESPDPPVLAR